MKTYYYYTRDDSRKPVGTHCFIVSGKQYARGTAICSPRDEPNKALGKRIATGRAIKAMSSQRSKVSGDGSFLTGAYMPENLIPLEEKFLQNNP